jgi:hypothetical protein
MHEIENSQDQESEERLVDASNIVDNIVSLNSDLPNIQSPKIPFYP